MIRVIFITLMCLVFSGCAFQTSRISGSFAPDVRNYSHFEKRWSVKTTTFECDFRRISAGLTEGDTYCKLPVNSEYVSFFTSFIHYNSGNTSEIYIQNLAREIQLSGSPVEKKLIAKMSSEPANVFTTFQFNKLQPSSFIARSGKNTIIYLSLRDVFLRNKVYATFRLTGLKPRTDKPVKYLSDYMLQYAVFPQVIKAGYSTNWLSRLTGAPLYSKAEELFEVGQQEKVLNYFNAIEKSESGAMPYASPFVYGAELAQLEPLDGLKPASPEEGYGFFNEYLPSYKLIRIDVLYRDKNGEPITIKSYSRDDIDALLETQDERSGLYAEAEIPDGASPIIKFSHEAVPPRYKEVIPQYSEAAGLAYIYSSIGYSAITELVAKETYNLDKLPYDCIQKAGIIKFLEGAGMPEKKINAALAKYTDKLSACTGSEVNMTDIIFTRALETGKLIK